MNSDYEEENSGMCPLTTISNEKNIYSRFLEILERISIQISQKV